MQFTMREMSLAVQTLTPLKSQKTEDFETITGFSASIGSCPSLGADNPRLSLLGACPEKAVIDIWEVLIVVNKATSVYWAMDAPIWQR